MILATEPLSARQWQTLGVAHRETFCDPRRVVIYGQRSADDRLVFGGRGRYLVQGEDHIRDQVPALDARFRRLEATMRALFPDLEGARITHAWSGALGVTTRWQPWVHYDRATRIGIAGGYVGEGVAAANLAARMLISAAFGEDTWSKCAWRTHVPAHWPPEPLRLLGSRLAESLAERADSREFATQRPSPIAGRLFSRLTR